MKTTTSTPKKKTVVKKKKTVVKKKRATRKKGSKKRYKFDFIALEKAAVGAWLAWDKEDTEEHRVDLFKNIEKLTYGVLSVSNYEKMFGVYLDHERSAFDYTVHLWSRLITRSKVLYPMPGYEKYPLRVFIELNLRQYVTTLKKDEQSPYELIDLLEPTISDFNPAFVATRDIEPVNAYTALSKSHFSDRLMKGLLVFYSLDEIKRLYPLSVTVLGRSPKNFIDIDMPTDIKDFSMVLTGLAKKLTDEVKTFRVSRSNNCEEALDAAVRSTVFLASVVNTKFMDKSLLLSLDLNSLYRLATVAGGTEIKIPTLKELDTLLGVVCAISDAASKGEDIDKALKKSKVDLGLVFTPRVSVKQYLSNALETYDLFGDEKTETEPLINVLNVCIGSLEKVFDEMMSRETESTTEVIASFKEMTKAVTGFTDSLVNISNTAKSKLGI